MSSFFHIVVFVGSFLMLHINQSWGQNDVDEELEYEEITIKLNVDKLGVYEMDAIYFNESVYLPMIDLFGKLEIYLTHSPELDTISGFILSPENAFSLNQLSNKITFRSKEKTLTKQQIIATFNDVYIPTKVYEEMFGMTMNFNLRELTVFLRSDIELPIIKQLRIKNLRTNLSVLNGEFTADTTIQRSWNWIKGAMIDWSLQSAFDVQGNNAQSLRTSVGMEMLGGQLNTRTTISRDSLIHLQNFSAKWHYVNDRIPVVKQIELGNLNVSLKSQTFSNFYGVKFTNSPYFVKKTFGKYLVERKTNPGWDVELYINGVLINFTTADQNGYFNFEIPLIFGNSTVLLRYYGPWGQESSEEIQINIPFSFTAQKHLEYQVNTGISADSLHHLFHKNQFSYGISRRASVNAGYEYFAGNMEHPHVLSGALNTIIGKSTLFNYSYLHQSNHAFELLTRTKSNVVFSIKHKVYLKGQTIVQTGNYSESDFSMNFPLLNKKLKIYWRSSNRGIVNANGFSFFSESVLSFFYKRLNTSFSFFAGQQSSITWNTTLYFKHNWSMIHNSLYNVSGKRPESSSFQLQKKINKMVFVQGGMNYSYTTQQMNVNFALFVNLNFLRSGINTAASKKEVICNQTLGGSFLVTGGPKQVMAANTSSVGKSGIDVFVFLDVNHNNVKDDSEPLLKDISVGINKGQQVLTEIDSIHRFIGLEPYASYLISVENAGFESISWILEKETWSVIADPNQIKPVYVPVKPMGEVSLTVFLQRKGVQTGAKRMLVYILNEAGQVVGKGLTESDGTLSYLGLKPGKYHLAFDEKQLKGLGLSSQYPVTTFSINVSEQGDYVGDLEVVLGE